MLKRTLKKGRDQNTSTGPGMSSMYEDAHKRLFFRKKKSCPLANVPDSLVNYKNIKLLMRFLSEKGRILPGRITFLSAKKQRQIKTEIKKARALALLPFVKQ